MDKQQLILIGGGGHCKSCIDVIESEGKYVISGILDTRGKVNTTILGYPVIGTDDDIMALVQKKYFFLITIGQIKSATIRIKIFQKLKFYNAFIATIVASTAHVSKYAMIGEGSIIMHGSVVNAAAAVGNNCIINTNAHIEHDVVVGDHCHISTNTVVNGDCHIGSEVFIGSNSTLVNNVSIANNVVLGAGSVVLKDIRYKGIYAGNPAITLKEYLCKE